MIEDDQEVPRVVERIRGLYDRIDRRAALGLMSEKSFSAFYAMGFNAIGSWIELSLRSRDVLYELFGIFWYLYMFIRGCLYLIVYRRWVWIVEEDEE
jgi:hypothetical protein